MFTFASTNLAIELGVVLVVLLGWQSAAAPLSRDRALHVWNDLFRQGHGLLTAIENVIIGPFIAMIAFVCSVGNVAMAAALWHGGIGFGGVISFIFADARVARGPRGRRHLPVARRGADPLRCARDHDDVRWNYTSVLNIVALVAVLVLLRLRSVTREHQAA